MKLPFLTKAIAQCVLLQLNQHIEKFKLHDPFQPGFRKGCSTKTATLNITDNILHLLDAGEPCLPTLLDLSMAFDTVNHLALLETLKTRGRISGMVLK